MAAAGAGGGGLDGTLQPKRQSRELEPRELEVGLEGVNKREHMLRRRRGHLESVPRESRVLVNKGRRRPALKLAQTHD